MVWILGALALEACSSDAPPGGSTGSSSAASSSSGAGGGGGGQGGAGGAATATSSASSTASASSNASSASASASSSGTGGGSSTGSGGTGGSGGSGGSPRVCTPGDAEDCYSGPAGTLGVGICLGGTRTCADDGLSWGACLGEITPQPETCLDTVDNDCNGETNEDGAGCNCAPGEVKSCYTGPAGTQGVGLCKPGTQACNAQGTGYSACTGDVTPQPETCLDAVDNDCNGQVNEGGTGCVCAPNSTASCYTGPPDTAGVGACKNGTKHCDALGTSYGLCTGDVLPQPEICFDAIDQNCDGQTNEGCSCTPGSTVPCYNGPGGTLGVGACAAGVQTCNAAGDAYGACMGEVLPQPETCLDAVDNDCNGQLNESGAGCVCSPNSIASCYTGPGGTANVGACKSGTQTCDPLGTGYGPCTGEVLPAAETCNTPADDDCNGQVNEGGAGCVCLPSSVVSCYTGPANTAGVGACKSGTQPCNSQGTALLGTCTGEVLPQPENCATPADDDCNGSAPPCSGTEVWGKAFGSALDDEGIFAAVDAADDVFLAGYVNNTVDYGCGPITAGGATDAALIVKFNAAGTCLWNKQYGSGAAVDAVAADAAANVYLTGIFAGTINFGGGVMTSAGLNDVFVTRLDPSGNYVWQKRFGDGQNQTPVSIVADASGDIILYGYFNGSMDFGGGALSSAGGSDIYLARLSPTGAHVWSKRFGDGQNQLGKAMALDSAGNILITGSLSGSVNFGGQTLTSAGLGDVFVAKFSGAGAHLWSKSYGDATDQVGTAIAADPAGNVILGGYYSGTMAIGSPPLVSAGSADAFAAKLDPSGTPLWSRSGGGTNNQSYLGIGADAFGNITCAGVLSGSGDFGGGVLQSAGSADLLMVKYDPAGNHLWSKIYGDSAAQAPKSMLVDHAGNAIVTGILYGPIDFGSGPVIGGGGEDTFFAKVSP